MVMGSVMLCAGGVSVDHLRGLGKRMPVTMAAFTVGGLSLIGVPGTVGFYQQMVLGPGRDQRGDVARRRDRSSRFSISRCLCLAVD